jgi:hypothetical protein
MIRRFIAKGKDIAHFTQKAIQQIIQWVNEYPRRILEYATQKKSSLRKSKQSRKTETDPTLRHLTLQPTAAPNTGYVYDGLWKRKTVTSRHGKDVSSSTKCGPGNDPE